jgi:hypothetical protein
LRLEELGSVPKSLWLFLTVLVAFLFAHAAVKPPKPLGPDAAPTVFSAGRAMKDVEQIAASPHPIGSEDAGRVRAYLMQRLAALGLEPEIHNGQGVDQGGRRGDDMLAAGAVQNIVAGLKGKDPKKGALLVMSHYDTVRNSPGAADDTAGVAAALEIARMMRARGQPERDVVFLFTDGEEAGLLGAQAFFAADPAAQGVAAVINMEARGDSGLAALFETGPGSAGLVQLYARGAKRPSATSMAASVYHRMPNGTDFTHAIEKKLPGINFAFEDDQGSLQHLGESAGEAAASLAFAPDLPKAGPDLVYGDILSRFFVSYPGSSGLLLLVLGAGLCVVAFWRAMQVQKIAPAAFAAEGGRGLLVILAWACGAAVAFSIRTTMRGPMARWCTARRSSAPFFWLRWGFSPRWRAARRGRRAGASRSARPERACFSPVCPPGASTSRPWRSAGPRPYSPWRVCRARCASGASGPAPSF